MSHPAETDSTPELSPAATNDGDPEGTGFFSNRSNDEVDDDDPLSKRRFDSFRPKTYVSFCYSCMFADSQKFFY